MSSLLGIGSEDSEVVVAAGVDLDSFVRNQADQSKDDGHGDTAESSGSGGKKKKKVSPFFAFMMKTRSDLVSSEDSRASDMEAVREVAGQRWQNMTPEEKQQFKTE